MNNELIGKKFRRNKYGLSTWTDTIRQITIRRNYTKKVNKFPMWSYIERLYDRSSYGWTVDIQVRGERENWYNLNEIVIYD